MACISRGTLAAADTFRVVLDFFAANARERSAGEEISDFTFGNPNEMPLAGLVAAIRSAAEPRRPDWFAYKTSEAEPRQAIADALNRELALPFEPEDIAMTQGAFGAIATAFAMLLDPGDEAILPRPGWFCYAPILAARGCSAVHAPLDPESFDLDPEAIARAITPRTRIVVVNSPANPTGRVYSRARLAELAEVLTDASERLGRRIFILSDEPYRRIRFDGVAFTSPAAVYPWTLIAYSYGKILLAPGQRLGYLAICPTMPEPERVAIRGALLPTQVALGWGFPDAVMQYAVPELETLSIDLPALTAKRDRLLAALRGWGYQMAPSQGTFYLWGKAPGGDAPRFCAALKAHKISVMPGTLFDCPANFRVCLTATEQMIERALAGFQAVAEELARA